MILMSSEISGEYYDYTRTMRPERPWVRDWHQRFVYRHMNALRGGTGMYSGHPEMAAARPQGCRWVFGDGKIAQVCMTFKQEEACTMRKILRHWRERGVDPAVEHAWGMRVDRCVGLTPFVADSRAQSDLPDGLLTSSPYGPEFRGIDVPGNFFEGFCLHTLPYYYRNNPKANYDYGSIQDPTDLCMPALWCDEPTLIAYSKQGFTNRSWPLPPEWSGVNAVQIARLSTDGPIPRDRVPVTPNSIRFSLLADEAVRITPAT